MSKKHTNYYFESFVDLIEYSCKSATLLEEILKNYSLTNLDNQVLKMHEIEHAADVAKHEVMEKLVKEFITPIEREDIMLMIQQIEEVTDTIEDVVRKLFMYHVKELRHEAAEFAPIIRECCDNTKAMLENFKDFKKPTKVIFESIVKINELEERGDRLHCDAIKRLYSGDCSSVEVITWTKMFDIFEECCDACEDVSDVAETIMLKNS